MSPALVGRFFTSEPPGKPLIFIYIKYPIFSCLSLFLKLLPIYVVNLIRRQDHYA